MLPPTALMLKTQKIYDPHPHAAHTNFDGAINTKRSELSGFGQSCDQVQDADTLVTNRLQAVSSLQNDRKTIYDSQSQIAFARRAVYADPNHPEALAWKLNLWRKLDDYGMPVATDEVIEYRNALSPNAEIRTGIESRAVLTRRFSIGIPVQFLGGGQGAIVAQEIVRDPGRNPLLNNQDPSDEKQSPSPSREGLWIHIYGEKTSPVMSFRLNGDSQWKRYNVITDLDGNTKNFYPHEIGTNGKVKGPEQDEAYLSFLSSIVRTYGPSQLDTVNLALNELPKFKGAPENSDAHLRGTIHIGPSLQYVEEAYSDSIAGRPSVNPILECTIPTTLDSTILALV